MASYRAYYISGPGRSWQDRLKIAAALVIGAGVVFAALVVSLSIAIVLVPVIAVAYLFRRQIIRRLLRSVVQPVSQPVREPKPAATGATIDAEYRVIRPGERRP